LRDINLVSNKVYACARRKIAISSRDSLLTKVVATNAIVAKSPRSVQFAINGILFLNSIHDNLL